MPAIEQTAATSPIGRDTPRVDGPLKVTGKAQYTSYFHFPGLLYGVPVEATIAKGKVVNLDTAAAEKMPGVRAIFHRENIGKIFRSVQGTGFEGITDERRPPFEDDMVRYYGQYVALAVADTFELPRPLPMRCASPTQRRSLALIRTSKPTTNRMSLRLR